MTLIEMLFVLGIILALANWMFSSYSDAQKSTRITQMHNDLRTISVAAVAYSSLAKDGSVPTAVTEAAFTLPAANSLDGQERKFLTGNIKDPWGGTYVIDASKNTVTCAGSEKEKVAPLTREF